MSNARELTDLFWSTRILQFESGVRCFSWKNMTKSFGFIVLFSGRVIHSSLSRARCHSKRAGISEDLNCGRGITRSSRYTIGMRA